MTWLFKDRTSDPDEGDATQTAVFTKGGNVYRQAGVLPSVVLGLTIAQETALENVASGSYETHILNQETIIINTIGDYEDFQGGNFTTDFNDLFTIDNNGKATYNGLNTIRKLFFFSATISKDGGGANKISMRLALNGTTLPRSEGLSENDDPVQIVSSANIEISTNDIISVKLTNNSSTSSIVVDLCRIMSSL